MSRYLELLKAEIEKKRQNTLPPELPKLPKAPFDSFDSRGGNTFGGKNDKSESNNPLPSWCSESCQCLEELECPDGMVMGCTQKIPPYEQVWKRLSTMKRCPLRN